MNMKWKMTPQEIAEYKQKWMMTDNATCVVVHSDLDVQCKDWCRRNAERWEWRMNAYTHVYAHTFWFETKDLADKFATAFEKWVNKGIA